MAYRKTSIFLYATRHDGNAARKGLAVKNAGQLKKSRRELWKLKEAHTLGAGPTTLERKASA